MKNTAARLDLRLTMTDKDKITRAAALRGEPVAAFVRNAALREADTTVAANLTVQLSTKESRRFIDALNAPFKPNKRLAKAMNDAKQITRS
jgi:uncharacterized protein (DUF1778 family)